MNVNIHYKDQEISDARLELAEKERLTYLGPNLTLQRCNLIIRLPTSRLHILPTRFMDCTIELKQELRNFRDWTNSSLKGCRFKGRMLGCDFGTWPGFTMEGAFGELEHCDFTEARLDLCRFLGCDTRTLRFPQWPGFTILDPVGRGRELLSVGWPGRFRPVCLDGPYQERPSTVALTFYAPNEARRCGTTEAELKAAIERFDFIVH